MVCILVFACVCVCVCRHGGTLGTSQSLTGVLSTSFTPSDGGFCDPTYVYQLCLLPSEPSLSASRRSSADGSTGSYDLGTGGNDSEWLTALPRARWCQLLAATAVWAAAGCRVQVVGASIAVPGVVPCRVDAALRYAVLVLCSWRVRRRTHSSNK